MVFFGDDTFLQADKANLSLSNQISLMRDGRVDTQDHTLTLTGPISGNGGLRKEGKGNLILTASNNFTGLTEIKAGTVTLANNGKQVLTGNVEIEAGATLAGKGNIGGHVRNKGALAPDFGGGMRIGGNYTQTAGATLALSINPAGGASGLYIGGKVNFVDGTTFNITALSGEFKLDTTYTLVESAYRIDVEPMHITINTTGLDGFRPLFTSLEEDNRKISFKLIEPRAAMPGKRGAGGLGEELAKLRMEGEGWHTGGVDAGAGDSPNKFAKREPVRTFYGTERKSLIDSDIYAVDDTGGLSEVDLLAGVRGDRLTAGLDAGGYGSDGEGVGDDDDESTSSDDESEKEVKKAGAVGDARGDGEVGVLAADKDNLVEIFTVAWRTGAEAEVMPAENAVFDVYAARGDLDAGVLGDPAPTVFTAGEWRMSTGESTGGTPLFVAEVKLPVKEGSTVPIDHGSAGEGSGDDDDESSSSDEEDEEEPKVVARVALTLKSEDDSSLSDEDSDVDREEKKVGTDKEGRGVGSDEEEPKPVRDVTASGSRACAQLG